MPLYEYQCAACHRRTEVLQRFDDPPLTECPECGGELRRLVSAPAFQFKGSGWYVTDYASKSSATAGAGGAEKSGSGSETAAAATESAKPKDGKVDAPKPAAGSPAKPAAGSE